MDILTFSSLSVIVLKDNGTRLYPFKTPSEGTLRTCDLDRGGWVEPEYEDVDEFEGDEVSCDGLDNDCDGNVDEDLVGDLAPLAVRQVGVCEGVYRVCLGGRFVEPIYGDQREHYESDEVSCDGLDNDCDGAVDEQLIPPLANAQEGVCVNSLKVCDGVNGWINPNYDELIGQFEVSETVCDGVDSDCDGSVDEGLSAPLAVRQVGVCEGALKVCEGISGFVEPKLWGECSWV